jgi:hypothetical protein
MLADCVIHAVHQRRFYATNAPDQLYAIHSFNLYEVCVIFAVYQYFLHVINASILLHFVMDAHQLWIINAAN